MKPDVKPLGWIGSSRTDLKRLPDPVQDAFGYALYEVQCGDHPRQAKPLRGFGGAGVVELIEDDDGNTYRAVYTVRFADVVYVLHVFQKKSRRGRATAKSDIETIRRRLRAAAEEYERWRRVRDGLLH